MKKHVLGTSLIIILVLTVTQVVVLAQNAPDNSARPNRIEGVWDESVTFRQCGTGDPLGTARGMGMFIHGGALTQTSDHFRASSGLGTWRHLDEQSYTSVFRVFRFNADDSFAGRTKITRNIELDKDGNTYTATVSLEVLNAADELIFTVCGTETATRLE